MKSALSILAKGVLFAGGLALLAATASPIAEASEADIKYRQTVMKALGGHMGSIAAIAKGQVGHSKHLFGHASAINAIAAMTSDIFPKGSGGENTRAKDEIWQKWSEFEKTIAALQGATAKLLEAANAGDPAAVGAALGGVGKACGGCHQPFRKPKS